MGYERQIRGQKDQSKHLRIDTHIYLLYFQNGRHAGLELDEKGNHVCDPEPLHATSRGRILIIGADSAEVSCRFICFLSHLKMQTCIQKKAGLLVIKK